MKVISSSLIVENNYGQEIKHSEKFSQNYKLTPFSDS